MSDKRLQEAADRAGAFTGEERRPAAQMAEMIALAMELRGKTDLARQIRKFAYSVTGMTREDLTKATSPTAADAAQDSGAKMSEWDQRQYGLTNDEITKINDLLDTAIEKAEAKEEVVITDLCYDAQAIINTAVERGPAARFTAADGDVLASLGDLVKGVRWWAQQGDGVPNDVWDAYRQAVKLVEGKDVGGLR